MTTCQQCGEKFCISCGGCECTSNECVCDEIDRDYWEYWESEEE